MALDLESGFTLASESKRALNASLQSSHLSCVITHTSVLPGLRPLSAVAAGGGEPRRCSAALCLLKPQHQQILQVSLPPATPTLRPSHYLVSIQALDIFVGETLSSEGSFFLAG